MLKRHFERYFRKLFELEVYQSIGQSISQGKLISRETGASFSIINCIPRFVGSKNYTDNFSLQWNRFKKTQFDSYTGMPLTANRTWSNTKWNPGEMEGKRLLEVGSGAGRFTEIFCKVKGLEVVSFDYSNAVDANYESNKNDHLLIFQGDIFELPLEKMSFDFVFCYGVLQHTPDPEMAFNAILEYLLPGGKFSIDVYRRMYTLAPWYFPKYFWRPITSRMDPDKLLKVVESYIPLWLPVDTFIKRIPKIGSYLAGMIPIPCWNYFYLGLSPEKCLEWAIMDTFDALAPKYDIPKTKKEIGRWCDSPFLDEIDIFYGSNGIVANGSKKT